MLEQLDKTAAAFGGSFFWDRKAFRSHTGDYAVRIAINSLAL